MPSLVIISLVTNKRHCRVAPGPPMGKCHLLKKQKTKNKALALAPSSECASLRGPGHSTLAHKVSVWLSSSGSRGFSKVGLSFWTLTIPVLGLAHVQCPRNALAQEKEGQDKGGLCVVPRVRPSLELSCGRSRPIAGPGLWPGWWAPRSPTQPASCSCLCRARILFLLQLLADHVPGVGLVASKCGIGM